MADRVSFRIDVDTASGQANLKALEDSEAGVRRGAEELDRGKGGIAWGVALGEIAVKLTEKLVELAKKGFDFLKEAIFGAGVEEAHMRTVLQDVLGDAEAANRAFEELRSIGRTPGTDFAGAFAAFTKLEPATRNMQLTIDLINELANVAGREGRGPEILTGVIDGVAAAFAKGELAGGRFLMQLERQMPEAVTALRAAFDGASIDEIIKQTGTDVEGMARKWVAAMAKLPRATTDPKQAIDNLRASWEQLKGAFGEHVIGGTAADMEQVTKQVDDLREAAGKLGDEIHPQLVQGINDLAEAMRTASAEGGGLADILVRLAQLSGKHWFDRVLHYFGLKGWANEERDAWTTWALSDEQISPLSNEQIRSMDRSAGADIVPPVTLGAYPTAPAIDPEAAKKAAEEARKRRLDELDREIAIAASRAERAGIQDKPDEQQAWLARQRAVEAMKAKFTADAAAATEVETASIRDQQKAEEDEAKARRERLDQRRQDLEQGAEMARLQVELTDDMASQAQMVEGERESLKALEQFYLDTGRAVDAQRIALELLHLEQQHKGLSLAQEILAAGPAGVEDFLRGRGASYYRVRTGYDFEKGSVNAEEIGQQVGRRVAPHLQKAFSKGVEAALGELADAIGGGA